MLYKALFHIAYVIVSFVSAAIFAMAMYTFELAKLTISFYSAFALLEGLHIFFVVKKQFKDKRKALMLNNIHFIVLAVVALFVIYFYANMNAWRNIGDNSIEFRAFSYFFDNIFLINLAFFIANCWFLCRNLLLWSFKKPL
jgi:uncharacterized membrane protein